MAYLAPADLRYVLDGTSDGTAAGSTQATAASLPDPILTRAIAEAQDEVDAKLAAKVTTPLDTPPDLVVRIVADIAAQNATLTLLGNDDSMDANHPVQRRYAQAELLLAGLASGSIPIPGGQPPVAEPQGTAQVANPYDGNLFGARDVGGLYPLRPGWDGYGIPAVIGVDPGWSLSI